MKQTIINGVPTLALDLDSCRTLGQNMENLNYAPTIQQSHSFFFLQELKQRLIDEERYEVLSDFKRLEDWHGINIPFSL